ncbi:hypothetical protein ACN28I_04445 [Archangium gephyra]|uniref:hypothetical protein n=1 Tax=Archangium gephyra TaxID=48 RepID=UPI003B828E9D
MPGHITWLCTFAVLLSILSGCSPRSTRTRTIVTGKIEPRQIHYVTTVEHTEEEPSGWRATCIHINIQRKNTGEAFLCKFGVEVPMQNDKGPISLPLAQRITVERIHEAARSVFGSATPESPLGMLCQTLKTTLKPLLSASIGGSRVNTECHRKTIPVQFGESAP